MSGGERWQLSGEQLLGALTEVETVMRREYAASLSLIAELATRDVAAELGYSGLVELVRDVLRISPTEARRRISHAAALMPVALVSGGTVPEPLPVTAAAVAEGVLGADHVEVIASTVQGLPMHVPDADRALAERTLVAEASRFDARTLTKVAYRLRAVLDQDGVEPTDRELAEPVNELHLHTRRDGRLILRGDLDPEASALVTAVLSPLAKPRPSSDTGPDPRTAAERQGDALVEVFHLAAAEATLPAEAGEKPHILVTVPLQSLRDSGGHAELDGVGALDAESARRIACDAKIIPVVLGSRSEPLDLGRASYTVSTALRRALILRDGGCAFPGCDRTHRWCHSHHIRHWADNGPTEPNNLVLLCGRHHRLIHHSPWECAVVDGHAEFRPPRFVDPDQRPRCNVLHAVARC